MDAVVVRSVLIYVEDKHEAAREIARVLRRGGRAVLHEPINRRMDLSVDLAGFDDIREAYERAKDMNPLCDFDEQDLVAAFEQADCSVELEMDESRWPARGREWAHGFRHGAPKGYSGYDMLLMGGTSEERADGVPGGRRAADRRRVAGDELPGRIHSCRPSRLTDVPRQAAGWGGIS